MTEQDPLPTRRTVSDAVESDGWRLLLGTLALSIPVGSLSEALAVAGLASGACGPEADAHLRLDVRADRVEVTLETRGVLQVTARDVELAHAISAALRRAGRTPTAPTGPPRPVQALELAIDALDIAAIRPFWKAVLALEDEPGPDPMDALVDPVWQLPAVWFQQMSEPRPQRNRIHLDITVAHDEAPARVQAALDAGGVLVSDDEARAFWILADVEGNEVCVCTWQDRDVD